MARKNIRYVKPQVTGDFLVCIWGRQDLGPAVYVHTDSTRQMGHQHICTYIHNLRPVYLEVSTTPFSFAAFVSDMEIYSRILFSTFQTVQV